MNFGWDICTIISKSCVFYFCLNWILPCERTLNWTLNRLIECQTWEGSHLHLVGGTKRKTKNKTNELSNLLSGVVECTGCTQRESITTVPRQLSIMWPSLKLTIIRENSLNCVWIGPLQQTAVFEGFRWERRTPWKLIENQFSWIVHSSASGVDGHLMGTWHPSMQPITLSNGPYS